MSNVRPAHGTSPVDNAIGEKRDASLAISHTPKAARLGDEHFRLLVESVLDYAIFMLDPTGHIISWNAGAQRIKGYSADEIIGHSFTRFYPAEDVAAGKPARVLAIATAEGRVEDEGWRIRKDGSRFWASVVITALRDADGKLVGFAKVTRDLTERKRAEEQRAELAREQAARAEADQTRQQVEAAQRHLEAVIQQMPGGVIIAEAPSGRVMLSNQQVESLLGVQARRPERIADYEHWNGRRPDGTTVHALEWPLARALAGETVTGEEIEILRPGGSSAWLSVNAAPVRDGGGSIGAAVTTLYDVSYRKAVENRLAEEARIVEMLHRTGSTVAAELDLERVAQSVTDAATAVTGAAFGAFFYIASGDRGELHTLYALSGVSREAFADMPMPRNTPIFGPTFSGHGVVRSDDITRDPRYGHNPPFHGMPAGHIPVRSYLATPVVSRNGEVLGGLFLGHQVPGVFTERAERLLSGIASQAAIAIDNASLYREVQRAVRTRDDFLAAAAHDLKTPLTAIKGTAQILRRRVQRLEIAEADRLVEGLNKIDGMSTKMAIQIEELLDIARLEMGQPLVIERRPTDLLAVIRQVIAEHELTSSHHDLTLSTDLERFEGMWDPVRIGRVFANLVGNAIKYSPDGGEVLVLVEREAGTGGDWAVVSVSDRGLGIPEADLPRIFERFQRASNVAGRIAGTGIGLAICRRIVQRHGGTISVESQQGVGTTFTVRLPVDAPAVEDQP